jgi:hypothetical protein
MRAAIAAFFRCEEAEIVLHHASLRFQTKPRHLLLRESRWPPQIDSVLIIEIDPKPGAPLPVVDVDAPQSGASSWARKTTRAVGNWNQRRKLG